MKTNFCKKKKKSAYALFYPNKISKILPKAKWDILAKIGSYIEARRTRPRRKERVGGSRSGPASFRWHWTRTSTITMKLELTQTKLLLRSRSHERDKFNYHLRPSPFWWRYRYNGSVDFGSGSSVLFQITKHSLRARQDEVVHTFKAFLPPLRVQ